MASSLAQVAIEDAVVLAVVDRAVDHVHAWGLDAVLK